MVRLIWEPRHPQYSNVLSCLVWGKISPHHLATTSPNALQANFPPVPSRSIYFSPIKMFPQQKMPGLSLPPPKSGGTLLWRTYKYKCTMSNDKSKNVCHAWISNIKRIIDATWKSNKFDIQLGPDGVFCVLWPESRRLPLSRQRSHALPPPWVFYSARCYGWSRSPLQHM